MYKTEHDAFRKWMKKEDKENSEEDEGGEGPEFDDPQRK